MPDVARPTKQKQHPVLHDQYAEKVADVWNCYIGSSQARTKRYREPLISTLKEFGVEKLIDTACGTGVDSVMLVEEGFQVTSCDFSDRMLKHALQTRWDRRKDPRYDQWIIEEANWLTLPRDLPGHEGQYEAVLCLGNSFSHLPDFSGNRSTFSTAIQNFYDFLKPGGILIIDHRNFDAIIETGVAPACNLYYEGKRILDVSTTVLSTNGKPSQVVLDYTVDVSPDAIPGDSEEDTEHEEINGLENAHPKEHFKLTYYPHKVEDFAKLLKDVFGHEASYRRLYDFKKTEDPNTGFFQHIIQKHS